jgi:hypothetical protein
MKQNNERIEELVRQKLEGKSYGEIRESLRQEGLNEEEIRTLIRQADEKVLEEVEQGVGPDRGRQFYRLGLFLAVTGLLLSVVYNAGWLFGGRPAWLVYSPFLAGIALMFYGKSIRRRPSRKKEEKPGRIRRKRPYK